MSDPYVFPRHLLALMWCPVPPPVYGPHVSSLCLHVDPGGWLCICASHVAHLRAAPPHPYRLLAKPFNFEDAEPMEIETVKNMGRVFYIPGNGIVEL